MRSSTLAVCAFLAAAAVIAPAASAASLRFVSSGDNWTLRIHIGGGVCTSADPWGTSAITSRPSGSRLVSGATGHEGRTSQPLELRLKARRTGEGIVVTATGANSTGGWQTRLMPAGFQNGLPTFQLENRKPRGLVTQIVTPFTQRATTPVAFGEKVRVVVGDRVYRVRVK